MTIDWTEIKHFSEDEFRPPGFEGDVPISLGFLLKLDNIREHTGSPIRIHKNGGYALTGHSKNSLHYMGLAADLHLCETDTGGPRDVIDQALLAYKWTFLSIGIYPYWNKPGLHLDDRTAVGRDKIVWFKDQGGEYHFYPYNAFHLCIKDLFSDMSQDQVKSLPS